MYFFKKMFFWLYDKWVGFADINEDVFGKIVCSKIPHSGATLNNIIFPHSLGAVVTSLEERSPLSHIYVRFSLVECLLDVTYTVEP